MICPSRVLLICIFVLVPIYFSESPKTQSVGAATPCRVVRRGGRGLWADRQTIIGMEEWPGAGGRHRKAPGMAGIG